MIEFHNLIEKEGKVCLEEMEPVLWAKVRVRAGVKAGAVPVADKDKDKVKVKVKAKAGVKARDKNGRITDMRLKD